MKGVFTDEGAEKLWETLKFLEAKPSVHRQGIWCSLPTAKTVPTAEKGWSCGTAACLAGWLGLRDGWLPALDDSIFDYMDPEDLDIWEEVEIHRFVNPENGIDRHVADLATEILTGSTWCGEVRLVRLADGELHPRTLGDMYSGSNSRERLWAYAEAFSDGYIKKEQETVSVSES